MKRLFLLFVLFLVSFAAFPRFVGDVNDDGSVTIADVTALVNVILGQTDSPAQGSVDFQAADVNGDGTVTIADVTALVNIILGKDSTTEIATDDVDTLFINYTADGATYRMPQAWATDVTVTVEGTAVRVVNTNTTDEYVTALSGTCSNGSFVYEGSFKTSIVLQGLTLTNQQGAAIDIEDGKRVSLQLAEGTSNTLVDGTGSQKAALYCKGHLEVSGGGSLSVQGNVKHAISAKEYIELKKTTGTIHITGALSDGIHAGQYYEQKGGNVIIEGVTGDGIQAEAELDGSEGDGQLIVKGGSIGITLVGNDVAGLKCDSLMTIAGGEISVNSTGDDVKALKSNSHIVVSDGTLTLTQSGGYMVNTVSTDGGTIADPSYTTALKADSTISVTGGTIIVNNTADGGRGLNADGGISIEGGTLDIHANGEGGVLDLSSSGSTTVKSYRLYVAVPTTSGGGYPGGQQQSAWTNVYLYDSTNTLVAALTNQKSFTVNGATTTFYYYDFGAATTGTYYFKSDNYSSGFGGMTSYAIRTSDINVNLTGSDVFYSIANSYSTSGSTRTYRISDVTSTYANASSAASEGETYKAFCLKTDADVNISGGTLTLVHSGTMSKGIKADGDVVVSGGDIDVIMGGSYMIVGSDPAYATAVKCNNYFGRGGRLTMKGTGSASRGISTDGQLSIADGTYDITLTGDGATYTGNGSTEGVGCRGLKSDGNMTLQGGTITIKSSARGGKGIKVGSSSVSGAAGAHLVIGDAGAVGQGPELTVSTTGTYLATESSGGGWGGGPMDAGFIGSCKAVKCMGAIDVYGGAIALSTSSNGAEGLESKSTITFHGGTLESSAYDDAINAASTITFNDGNVWAHASNNDAIDSNDRTTGIVVNAGVVIASGASSPEEGFDCDNAAFIINGGTVIGTGGSQGGGGGGGGLPTRATQPYVSLSSVSLNGGTYLSLKDSSGTVVCSYRIPATVGSAMVLMSSPELKSGSSATVVYGSTNVSKPSATLWNGTYTTGGALTGGTSRSVTPKTSN